MSWTTSRSNPGVMLLWKAFRPSLSMMKRSRCSAPACPHEFGRACHFVVSQVICALDLVEIVFVHAVGRNPAAIVTPLGPCRVGTVAVVLGERANRAGSDGTDRIVVRGFPHSQHGDLASTRRTTFQKQCFISGYAGTSPCHLGPFQPVPAVTKTVRPQISQKRADRGHKNARRSRPRHWRTEPGTHLSSGGRNNGA